MNRVHKQEIIRWANSKEGTRVWGKDKYGWHESINPAWNKNTVYILDDELAEIRKAHIDGKTIQVKINVGGHWVDKKKDDSLFNFSSTYRIKPEESIYEYQWVIKYPNNEFSMTSYFYISEEEIKGHKVYNSKNIVEKYEPSKREREVNIVHKDEENI